MRTNSLFLLCAALILASLVLGGGTSAGFLSDVALQLLAIPMLLVSLHRLSENGRAKWPLLFCAAVVLVPLLQLVPLPPSVWTRLPGRETAAAGFELLGRPPPWMPISAAPDMTWASLASLIPPLAIFIATLQLGYRARRSLALLVLAASVFSVFLGLTQIAQGPTSGLRFFEVTNTADAVGFFANRNHFAAFLYAATVLAAVWAVEAGSGGALGREALETRRIVGSIAIFTVLVLLLAAQAMTRSRAGLGLTIVALLGCVALAVSDRRTTSGLTPKRLLLGATVLGIMFIVQFALYRLQDRFGDPLQDARLTFSRLTLDAAVQFLPFGSGMGTFVPVYGLSETPQTALIGTYANRAHNDVLELLLETGVLGFLLGALFLAWFVAAAWRVWRRPGGGREVDVLLARAATIVIGLVLAHSLVDYPLRTGAMMAIAAFACALLIDPPERPEHDEQEAPARAGWAEPPPVAAREAMAMPQPPPIRPFQPQAEGPRERWGQDIAWPDAWSRGPAPDAPDSGRAAPRPDKPWPTGR